MAIVEYKCDTCKREIELQRNINGLEIVGRCIITHGCRGSLYQTKLHPDYIRGSIPDPVAGLDDWKQRKVLHNHVQTIEREEWLVEHDMGVVPTVSVFVDRPIQGNLDYQEEITPTDIIVIDDNNLKLKFDKAWSGNAQLVSRQSDPNLLQPIVRTTEVDSTPYQISNLGEISIATRLDVDQAAPIIQLRLEYVSALGVSIIETYFNVDDQPSINSAWQGAAYDRIIVNVNSTRYPFTVRSFNGVTASMTGGDIESGSTFKFRQIDTSGVGSNWRIIQPGEVLILLATPPYDIVDKVFNQYIDVADVSDTNNQFGFYYNNGEFFALTETITSVYPPISNIDN